MTRRKNNDIATVHWARMVVLATALAAACSSADEGHEPSEDLEYGLAAISVQSLTLINADSNQPIAGFDPIVEGASIDLAALPTQNLNVRANTSPGTVGSVRFGLDSNSNYRTESSAPYALAGDTSGDYYAWAPSLGAHTIVATPYTGSGATGDFGTAKTVHFTATSGGGGGGGGGGATTVSGELKKWHKVSVTCTGPSTGEGSSPNPFLDHRMNVTFTKGTRSLTVPGYYACDGNAANSSATSGDKWRAHFAPDEEGTWSYAVSFRSGAGIAVGTASGSAAGCDGATGTFTVGATDKTGRDHRGKGLLKHGAERYLRFQNGEYFLKGGADSPENFLAYHEFDGTPAKHVFAPHAGDYVAGDATWQGGKGKNIVGALNYLAGRGMNSVYFLTMNVTGDGNDVWPWTASSVRDRFDCSKLDQWETVFEHMDKKGLALHVVTQETENDQLLDGGALGTQRKLYYRELVARFGHHLAVVWNLGEENTNTDAERKAFATHIRGLDAYDHPVVVHTYPGQQSSVYSPLLGFADLDGPSLQNGDKSTSHSATLSWINQSTAAGKPWFVSVDEIGPADVGVLPDSVDASHEAVREQVLWGNLMAGGAGVEWYFGYAYPHDDLDCEDWRSRDAMWNQTRHALTFFQAQLPFWQMKSADGLTSSSSDYAFAKEGQAYAVFLPSGGATNLDLGTCTGTYTVKWYDPRNGGALQNGSVTSIEGPGSVTIGSPPSSTSSDWVALIKLSVGDSNCGTGGGGGGSLAVQSFTLINADTDQPVAGYDPIADGATIDLSNVGTSNLNLRANTSPSTVGSVRFGLDANASYKTESAAPYALAGDTNGNYAAWSLALGAHTVTGTPYELSGAGGTAGTAKTIGFTIVQ